METENSTTGAPSGAGAGWPEQSGWGGTHSLDRPHEGRMIAGVATGIADYFDIDVVVVRILIVVLTLFGGAGIPLYAAGWLLMPDRSTGWSVADHVMEHSHSY